MIIGAEGGWIDRPVGPTLPDGGRSNEEGGLIRIEFLKCLMAVSRLSIDHHAAGNIHPDESLV